MELILVYLTAQSLIVQPALERFVNGYICFTGTIMEKGITAAGDQVIHSRRATIRRIGTVHMQRVVDQMWQLAKFSSITA